MSYKNEEHPALRTDVDKYDVDDVITNVAETLSDWGDTGMEKVLTEILPTIPKDKIGLFLSSLVGSAINSNGWELNDLIEIANYFGKKISIGLE